MSTEGIVVWELISDTAWQMQVLSVACSAYPSLFASQPVEVTSKCQFKRSGPLIMIKRDSEYAGRGSRLAINGFLPWVSAFLRLKWGVAMAADGVKRAQHA
eukprot:68850-Amphidinium_carterae.2